MRAEGTARTVDAGLADFRASIWSAPKPTGDIGIALLDEQAASGGIRHVAQDDAFKLRACPARSGSPAAPDASCGV